MWTTIIMLFLGYFLQFWAMTGITSGVFMEKEQFKHSVKRILCPTEESKSYGLT